MKHIIVVVIFFSCILLQVSCRGNENKPEPEQRVTKEGFRYLSAQKSTIEYPKGYRISGAGSLDEWSSFSYSLRVDDEDNLLKAEISFINTQPYQRIEIVITEKELGWRCDPLAPLEPIVLKQTIVEMLRRFIDKEMEDDGEFLRMYPDGIPTEILEDKELIIRLFTQLSIWVNKHASATPWYF